MKAVHLTALLLAATLPWPTARAQTTANLSPKVEVLSLTVAKLPRDGFGNAVSPFAAPFFNQVSGTAVLAKITPADTGRLSLQEARCRLLSFKDDRGTDLAGTNSTKRLGDPVFSQNRPFEIVRARDAAFFGIQLRSGQTPDPSASRIIAEVMLSFGRSSDEQLAQEAGVELSPDRSFVVGPVKLEIIVRSAPFKSANSDPEVWLARMLPEKDVAVSSVTMFSETEDTPLLQVKDLKASGEVGSASTSVFGGTASGQAPSYGFKPPANRRAIIKVRYFKAEALLEQRCTISTGIGP